MVILLLFHKFMCLNSFSQDPPFFGVSLWWLFQPEICVLHLLKDQPLFLSWPLRNSSAGPLQYCRVSQLARLGLCTCWWSDSFPNLQSLCWLWGLLPFLCRGRASNQSQIRASLLLFLQNSVFQSRSFADLLRSQPTVCTLRRVHVYVSLCVTCMCVCMSETEVRRNRPLIMGRVLCSFPLGWISLFKVLIVAQVYPLVGSPLTLSESPLWKFLLANRWLWAHPRSVHPVLTLGQNIRKWAHPFPWPLGAYVQRAGDGKELRVRQGGTAPA